MIRKQILNLYLDNHIVNVITIGNKGKILKYE